MKLFDSSTGKVMGWINIIDLVVIIAFICLIPSCVVGWKIMTNQEVDQRPFAPGPRDLVVRWEVPEPILPFFEEVMEAKGKEINYKRVGSDRAMTSKGDQIWWCTTFEQGSEVSRAGQRIESRKPLGIKGLILSVRKKGEVDVRKSE
jgi:hypothetical protein